MIPFTYLCPRLLSSAFVRFWFIRIAGLLILRFSFTKLIKQSSPLPLRQREGFFFPPKHSHEKFFRKFFQIYPSDFFLIFWREFVMRKAASFYLSEGGYPFCWLVGLSLPFFRSASLPFVPFFPCCVPRFVGGWCWWWCCFPCSLVGWACLPALVPSLLVLLPLFPCPCSLGPCWVVGFRSLHPWAIGSTPAGPERMRVAGLPEDLTTAQKWLK